MQGRDEPGSVEATGCGLESEEEVGVWYGLEGRDEGRGGDGAGDERVFQTRLESERVWKEARGYADC